MKKITRVFMALALQILLLPILPVFASQFPEETASISRIVGESPTEMLRQLQRNEIDISHAAFYSNDNNNGIQKAMLINNQFGQKKFTNWLGTNPFPLSFGLSELNNKVKAFTTNELFVLETVGNAMNLENVRNIDPNTISPQDVRGWQETFEQKNPLFLFDSPYAGIYLPKQDSFVSRLVRDSTIIAPASYNSPQFTKSFLCQLWDGKNIGKAFMDARNFHYNGGSSAGSTNFLGLVLQSYTLFGNPLQIIKMDWKESDFQKIKKTLCHNNLDNLESGMEYLGQVGNYSKFRKYIIFSIGNHNIESQGDFALLNASNTYQNLAPSELVLPMAVRTTFFPIQTLITNFSVVEVKDLVDITINNLPSYLPLGENPFTERSCFEDYQNYSISFANAFTEDSQKFIAEIHPVEIRNCTTGELTLYRTFNYSIDFIAVSPVLIKSLSHPAKANINEKISMDIELMKLSQEDINGSLVIFDQNNNKLVEKEMVGFAELANGSFYAPAIEGPQSYSIEYVYNGSTVALKKADIDITILEISADIPPTVPSNPSISLNFFSYFNSDFTLNGKYALIDNDSTMQSGEFSMAIKPGSNTKTISFSGLNRTDQSYTLTIGLTYLSSQRSASFLLVTNNIPVIISDINSSSRENETISLNVSGIDLDNDTLIVDVQSPQFSKAGSSSYQWKTDFGDSGNYSVTISASDGFVTNTRQVNFEVAGTPDLVVQKTFINGDDSFNSLLSQGNPEVAYIPMQKDAVVLAAKASLYITHPAMSNKRYISSFDFTDNKTFSDSRIENESFTIEVIDKSTQVLNITYAGSRINCIDYNVCTLIYDSTPNFAVYINGKEICRSPPEDGSPNCLNEVGINNGAIFAGGNALKVYQRAPSCCKNQLPIDQLRLENPRGYIARAQSSSSIQLSIDTGNDSSTDFSFDKESQEVIPKADLNITAINNFLEDCKEDDNNTCLVPIVLSSSTGADATLSGLKIAYLPKNGTFWNYTLKKGWNMISFPFELSRKGLNEGPLRTFPNNCTEKLVRYNASTKELKGWNHSEAGWKADKGDIEEDGEENTELEEAYGYWIKVGEDCRITVRGKAPLQKDITLSGGWNLIGFPSQEELLIDDAIQNVKGQLNAIMLYENGGWFSYYSTRPPSFNSLSIFEPGKGYWIRINTTGEEWLFDAASGRFVRQ